MGRLLNPRVRTSPGARTWGCILPACPGSRYAGKLARDFNRLPAGKPDSAQSLNSGDVFLAITEDNLSSQIKAGENTGHTLHHSAVVRDFRRIGQLQRGNFEAGVPLKFDQGWKRGDLRVVVFVQTAGDGRIQGASQLTLK